jgi:hypothetical protein
MTGLSYFLKRSYRLRKTRKTSARRMSDGVVLPVIVSNGLPYLQMRSVGSHNTLGREVVRPVITSNGIPYLQMMSVDLHITSGRGKERTG